MVAFRGADRSGPNGIRGPASAKQREPVALDESAQRAAPPIDLDHLRRYTFGDEKLEREVLELFSIHAPGFLTELKSAGTVTLRQRAAHSLKGSALAVGAWDVARRAEQLEACAARHDEGGGMLAGLEHAVDQARRFIAAASGKRRRG